MRMGLCQISVGADKKVNIDNAQAAIIEAVGEGAQMVSLPECERKRSKKRREHFQNRTLLYISSTTRLSFRK